MCNAWNHDPDCWCGFGGDTGGGGYGATALRTWTITETGRTLAHSTLCWWCGAPVYFFRNENGGCALFDRLGWPWPLHSCWEEYRYERSRVLSAIETELRSGGFDGRWQAPEGQHASAPKGNATFVVIQGFVADKDGPTETFVGDGSGVGDGASFPTFIVQDSDGVLFDLLVPEPWYDVLDDYAPIRAEARWCVQDGEWHLFALSIETRSFGTGRVVRRHLNTLGGRPLTCDVCDRRVGGEVDWGFDPRYQVECHVCAKARGSLSPAAFVRLCRRIAAHPSSRTLLRKEGW
jgi:hypothetical protein